MSDRFDLIVVGTGSGNTFIDSRFKDQRVAIVERDKFGGTCLNRGCIPSKMLVYPAKVIRDALGAQRLGVDLRVDSVRWTEIRDRIFGRIDPIADSGEDYRRDQENVEVFDDDARFVGDHRLRVGDRTIEADSIVLAAGGRPIIPSIEGLEEVAFHTSDTIMRIEQVPDHLIIIGGGFIAAEMGHVFSAFGSRVTVVNRSDKLLRGTDLDISQRFTELFSDVADLRLGTTATAIGRLDDGVEVALDDGSKVVGDTLLVATGRVPNGAQLEVTKTGVEMDDAGYVVTDDTLLTTADGIWALGDIRNPRELKHLANREAKIVGHNLIHPEDPKRIDQRAVPTVIFSAPEVAWVGATQQELDEAGVDYRVQTRDYSATAYGWAMEDEIGFAKALIDPETETLLGAHIIGHEASMLIQPLVQAMQFRTPIGRVATEVIYPHPSLTEVVEQVLLG